MAKIDVYFRSIERFGAAGAVLTSGQSVTLKFPTGDRHATQVTPHDQLVAVVREVAPPQVIEQIDKQRAARFELDSNGIRYAVSVMPNGASWQVVLEPVAGGPVTPPSPTAISSSGVPVAVAPQRSGGIQKPRAPSAPPVPPPPSAAVGDEPNELPIERSQYTQAGAGPTTSGSVLLDSLTAGARTARATDLYLATGAQPMMRVGGELQPLADRGALDAETISRELGVVAPAAARAAWTEKGLATFAYGDGSGRIRATLSRDHRGPSAALRILIAEAPALDRLGIGRECVAWLDQRGLVLVAGPSGSGKTTALAAIVRALGDKRKRVVSFEDPIELVQTGQTVSQRAVGEHVPSLAAGVAAAMREAADAIAVSAVTTPEHAGAVVDAMTAGHLVVAAIAAKSAREASDQLVDLLPYDRREQARGALEQGLLGTIAPILKGGGRSYEIVSGRGG